MAGDVERFIGDLEAFSQYMGIKLQTVVKRTALEIFTNIVRRTPVRTGLARASWVIGVNAFAAPADVFIKENENLSPSAAASMSLARASNLQVNNPYSVVVISNYLPYIKVLENGSSSQAPNGMARLSVEESFARLRAFLS